MQYINIETESGEGTDWFADFMTERARFEEQRSAQTSLNEALQAIVSRELSTLPSGVLDKNIGGEKKRKILSLLRGKAREFLEHYRSILTADLVMNVVNSVAEIMNRRIDYLVNPPPPPSVPFWIERQD